MMISDTPVLTTEDNIDVHASDVKLVSTSPKISTSTTTDVDASFEVSGRPDALSELRIHYNTQTEIRRMRFQKLNRGKEHTSANADDKSS